MHARYTKFLTDPFLIDDGLRRVSGHMESVGELDIIALLNEAEAPSSAGAP